MCSCLSNATSVGVIRPDEWAAGIGAAGTFTWLMLLKCLVCSLAAFAKLSKDDPKDEDVRGIFINPGRIRGFVLKSGDGIPACDGKYD